MSTHTQRLWRLLAVVLVTTGFSVVTPSLASAALPSEGNARLGWVGFDGNNDLGGIESVLEAFNPGWNYSWDWASPYTRAWDGGVAGKSGVPSTSGACELVKFFRTTAGQSSPGGANLGDQHFYLMYTRGNSSGTVIEDDQTQNTPNYPGYFRNTFQRCNF